MRQSLELEQTAPRAEIRTFLLALHEKGVALGMNRHAADRVAGRA
jgi:hypothetical protein